MLLADFWTSLLPAGVRFSAGFETDESSAVEPRDARELIKSGTLRAREFALGRWHARRALREFGIDDAPLTRRVDGPPVWPEGVVGSIAHTFAGGRVFAVAAVAPRTLLSSIGVDIEAPALVPPRAWPALLTSAELDRVIALAPVDRAREVVAVWCAKEAVAKALQPRCEIKAIVIEHDGDAAQFVAHLPSPADAFVSGVSLGACVGNVLDHRGWIAAVAGQSAPLANIAWPGAKISNDDVQRAGRASTSPSGRPRSF